MIQGRIMIDETPVYVIKREFPVDKTPCMTIDNSGGTAIVDKHIIDKVCKLPETHPQYDEDNPYRSQQVIREERSISLDLSIWCDSEDERDRITDAVMDCFYKIQSDHYTYCSQYNDGTCDYLEEDCKVTPYSMRGIKAQCPKPKDYHYENIFHRWDIIRTSFDVEPPYDMDELNQKPPIRRSIIRISFSYYDYYNIGGAITEHLIVDEELL